jgi:hypothetical protein
VTLYGEIMAEIIAVKQESLTNLRVIMMSLQHQPTEDGDGKEGYELLVSGVTTPSEFVPGGTPCEN